jgi:hypothetical protein
MKDAQKPDHISLSTLVSYLREGRFVIPDFQREFEWKPWDIRELMRSIFLDYYIGSLLLWKGKPDTFAALSCEHVYGYSLTVAGRAALANLDTTTILIAQPGSLAATFNGYQPLFGDGFHQRAMEAIKCRNAEAWLACCAMVGAAAESVLLAIAITKEGDEERVLRAYHGNRGRQAVLNMIVGQADAHRRNTLTTFAGIVSLWRDDAAHGRASPIDTSNADEALRQLLHMCQWVAREWDNLTA